MQDTEMSDVEKFPINEEYCSITEFNSLSSAFPTDNFSSIPDDLPLSNNFGCYNDSMLGNINAIIHHADENEIQRELGFYLLDESVLDPIINLDASDPPSNSDETVNIPRELLENATHSNSLFEVASIDKRKKSTKKTKRKSKTFKGETEIFNLEKSFKKERRYISQATVTASTDTSKLKSDKVEPIPKLIIKLTPRPTVPDTSNSYFAPTIADKVKMGRRRQTNKLTDYEFSSMLQTFEKTQKKSRKRQKSPLSSVNDKISSSKCVEQSNCFKMTNVEESQSSCQERNIGNQSNSMLSISSQSSNVAVNEVASDSLIRCSYNNQSSYGENPLNVEKPISETGKLINTVKNVGVSQNLGKVLIKKEINVPENNKQRHIKKENNELEAFENFSVESCIEIVKEEPLYEESDLFTELFDPDVNNFFANESVLTDELEKAIFDEEHNRATMNGFDLEKSNTIFHSDLFDNQIPPKSNCKKVINNVSYERTNLNLSEENSKCLKTDCYVSNNLPSAETPCKSKISHEISLSSPPITSKVVLESIEVSTPELELELHEHDSPDSRYPLPVDSQQVPYSSEVFDVTQVLNEKSFKANNVLKKENFHPGEIHSYDTVSPLHPNISRRRKLSSSSSSCSQSSYSCYSSSELPNSSSSPNSCFSPGKRQRRNSRSLCNYDKKHSSRHFRADAVSCTNYENHVGSPKNSPQCPLDNQDNFRCRNVSGSSSSSQSSSPTVRDHNHYRSLSKSFSRDKTGNSRSRSRSPSHSEKYRSSSKWKSSSSSNTHRYQIDQRENFEAIEERRVLYVGDIPPGYTVKMLTERFSRFGPIEDVQIKSKITNCVQKIFGFVTFKRKADAFQAIERGNDNPLAPKFDLNFGGRRRFCNGDYTDLDGKVAEVEGGWYDYKPKPAAKDDDDVFAKLLAKEKARQESIKKKK
ncbi:uncharacterized protein LOC129222461 [Uloborus diversus]|uniref:uncharacterized protein LOC129222461 n=1 Tax=Uloborus diversus TaxID=327109 RepID=UPI00240A4475|nr:uncharacterized protein LOC129222461 [Uloborus diversus]